MSAPETVTAAARRLIDFLETGRVDPELFTEDLFTDFTSPTWRVQAAGRANSVELRRRGHPTPGKVEHHRVLPTPEGFVLQFEERWTDARDEWSARECLLATLRDGRVCALSVYCTGDWSSQRRADHARQVTLIRP